MMILVVDDEKDVQRLFQQRFRKERRKGQIEFNFAFSGEEALNFLREEEGAGLALLLSDINMPKMNGLELLQVVRDEFPQLKIFMVTAYGDEDKKRKAFDFGADDYLLKPIDFKMLKEKILEQAS